MKKISEFLLYIYAFLVFYTPYIFNNGYLNYSIPFILLVIGSLNILFTKGLGFKTILRKKNVVVLIVLFFISSIYFIIRSLFAGTELYEIDKLRIIQNFMMLCSFGCIFVIVIKLEQLNYDKERKVSFVLNVALIQSLICLLMLIFPSLKELIVHQILLNGEGNAFTLAKRVYGISMNYTFATPIFHGVLATIALIYGLYKNPKYYIYIPFLLLAIVLNGRTGLFVFILGAILGFAYYFIDTKKITKVFRVLIIFVILVMLVFGILKYVKYDTYLFFIDGINDMMIFLFEGEKEGNINSLSSDAAEGIKNVNIIFGNGYRVYTPDALPKNIDNINFTTDIGYMNDLYMGGIIYILFLYSSVILFLCMGTKNEKDKKINRLIYFFILLTMFLCNMKGEVFRSTIILDLAVFMKLGLCDARFIKGSE